MDTIYKIAAALFFLFQFILGIYLIIPFVLLVIHSLNRSGKKMLEKKYPVVKDRDFDFAAIVTAHRDTRFIPPLVDSFCKQSYRNFILYVVADDCDISGLQIDDP